MVDGWMDLMDGLKAERRRESRASYCFRAGGGFVVRVPTDK